MNDEELQRRFGVCAPDALKEVWGMQEGELYIVKDGELKHLPRSDDDLPKVPVSEAARDTLLQVRRKCRKSASRKREKAGLVRSHRNGGRRQEPVQRRQGSGNLHEREWCPESLVVLVSPRRTGRTETLTR